MRRTLQMILQFTLIPDTLKLHFKTETKDLSTLAFWFWSDTYKPEVETLPTGTDDYGIYVDIDIKPFLFILSLLIMY